MAEGISPNPLNKISQVYLDRIAKINSDPEIAQKEREKWQTEAKVDTGSAEEKATARNKRNTPPGKDYKFDTSVFITRKPGESLDSARTRTRQKAHAAKRGVKENFSSWRNDLREIVDEIESKAEKEVKEKNVKNKVVINPVLTDAVEQMGGQLLEVAEVEDNGEDQDAQKAEALKKKEAMLKKRIVRMKMQAVNQGAGENIIASYDPLENAVEYFYEEGINEEGIDILIEEIGLDDFVDFVDGGGAIDLNEERAARKASVRAKKYDVVKKEVDTADAARKKAKKGEYAPSYAKKETDVTVYDDKPAAKKKAPAKKPAVKKEAPKPAPKKKIVKPVAKKVERAVTKVKKSQPKKEVSKKGIRGAIERGVARHKKAVGDAKAAYSKQRAKGKVPEKRAKEFASGVKSGVKTAVKFAKDVKKVVSEEELLEKDLSAAERRALPDKEFALPGKGKGPQGKQAGSYPIPDKSHARMALAMVAKHGTPEKKEKVRAAVAKKFPGIQQEDYETQKRKEVLSALKRDKRPLDKKTKDKIASDIVKKKGDTSKSDDRYAYESLQQEGLVGAKVDSQKEVNRATRKAAFRPFKNTTPPKLKNVAEDKALDIVRQRIIKKHGEGAIYDAKRDKPTEAQKKAAAAERQKRQAEKNKAFADRAKKAGYKNPQDYANVVARYGSEDNMKKGTGLGS